MGDQKRMFGVDISMKDDSRYRRQAKGHANTLMKSEGRQKWEEASRT